LSATYDESMPDEPGAVEATLGHGGGGHGGGRSAGPKRGHIPQGTLVR